MLLKYIYEVCSNYTNKRKNGTCLYKQVNVTVTNQDKKTLKEKLLRLWKGEREGLEIFNLKLVFRGIVLSEGKWLELLYIKRTCCFICGRQ